MVDVIGRLQETWYRATGRAELAGMLREERATVAHMQETMADLANRMYEPGWQQLVASAEQEFARDGLRQIAAVSRIMAVKNPLIKRGLQLRQGYVWGQGVQVSARATGAAAGEQDVQAVVQAFLTDPSNQRTFTGHQARETNERALGTDGNLFHALFTSPRTGRVQVRSLPFDEITDVITNPNDDSEPWFYRREWWVEETLSLGTRTVRQIAYYPALGYQPRSRPRWQRDRYGEQVEVFWDAPVYHVKVNSLLGWRFGIGDAYAAIDWAQAYKDFLTDWARLIKSLSRFAWRLTSKGSRQAAARARIAAAPSRDPLTGEPNHAGATASLPPDMALEAIPKSGATIDSESGRPLAAMIAAALDVPVTMLLGDPGVTGARATAQTLDAPTERAMESRRQVHTDELHAVLAYVIRESVRAPQGALKGTVTRDADGREIVTLDGGTDTTVDVAWPDLDDVNPVTVIDAIVAADGTGYLPPPTVVRLLLQALGVRDIDSILDKLTDEDGKWIPPDGATSRVGQAAVDRYRRGEDPATLFDPADGE